MFFIVPFSSSLSFLQNTLCDTVFSFFPIQFRQREKNKAGFFLNGIFLRVCVFVCYYYYLRQEEKGEKKMEKGKTGENDQKRKEAELSLCLFVLPFSRPPSKNPCTLAIVLVNCVDNKYKKRERERDKNCDRFFDDIISWLRLVWTCHPFWLAAYIAVWLFARKKICVCSKAVVELCLTRTKRRYLSSTALAYYTSLTARLRSSKVGHKLCSSAKLFYMRIHTTVNENSARYMHTEKSERT